jgi:hypothetical protein
MENMMNPPANTNILHGLQDGFSIAIPDYLGADMPCYPSIQTDLQAGMVLNDSGVRFRLISVIFTRSLELDHASFV